MEGCNDEDRILLTLIALHGAGRDELDLVEYAGQVAPEARLIAPRGDFMEGGGYTYFKRNHDRSIPVSAVVATAQKWISSETTPVRSDDDPTVLAGYSSGAVFAESLLSVSPHRFSGAILMRPQPLSPDFKFPEMLSKPILILAGEHDDRRHPQHAFDLAAQLTAAGAAVELHILKCGHGWAPDNQDVSLARRWLSNSVCWKPHSLASP